MLNFRMDGFLHSTDTSISLLQACNLGSQPEAYVKVGEEIWLFTEFEIFARNRKQQAKYVTARCFCDVFVFVLSHILTEFYLGFFLMMQSLLPTLE